ncbi:MAG: AAA family ATPase [Bacteroidota bacterium]
MKNKINDLKISNFKSIREAELDCARINLFVGKPNVGKSNVLEAISLLGAKHNYNKDKFLSEFIRYESFGNLYHFYDTDHPIKVITNIGGAVIFNSYEFSENELYLGPRQAIERQLIDMQRGSDFLDSNEDRESEIKLSYVFISNNGKAGTLFSHGNYSPIKKYEFKKNQKIDFKEKSFLLPPFGKNLFSILNSSKKLKSAIPELFNEYGFNFLIDVEENKFAIQRIENGISYKIPYSLVADTLQRIIFHYAAIFSNKDSVILFEEPENHSFPPYIRELALKIIESTDNQFFITTHSPYLFDTILENTPPEELALFITYFEDYETKFKKLNDDDIAKIMNYGLEVFFNLNHFVDE